MRDNIPTGPEFEDEPLGPSDPELRAALGGHFGETPESAVDWTALQGRIVDAARFQLAKRARLGGWRGAAERWGRVAVPVALAATALLVAGLAFGPSDDSAADSPAIEEIAAVSASDILPADPLSVTDQETFLAAILDPAER